MVRTLKLVRKGKVTSVLHLDDPPNRTDVWRWDLGGMWYYIFPKLEQLQDIVNCYDPELG